MNVELFQRVVLLQNIPKEELCRGDVATVVEIHRNNHADVIGYEVELFTADGRTLTVASVPVDAIRIATSCDRLTSRTEGKAYSVH
jgi:hypothetical protein